MPDLDNIRQLVQDAIDRGASSVEDVNKFIATQPLDQLAKFVPQLAGPAGQASDIASSSIGSVFDAIRSVNEQANEVAKQLLTRIPGQGGQG